MTNRCKRIAAVLTALVLAVAYLAAVSFAAEQRNTYRIYGQDRYETAFKTADMLKQHLGLEQFDAVVIASGKNFPDALTGSYLAVQNQAPILMTKGSDLNTLKDYLQKSLKPDGKVYILGGTSAVPATVDTALSQYRVIRLQGSTRYETNLQILRQIPKKADALLVCDGGSFADSLCASATNLPVLLINGKTNRLTDSQTAYLQSLGETKLYIIGGEKAVSKALEDALQAFGTVTRIGGATRVETSALLAKTFFPEPKAAVLAYSLNFPDGLCGGPLAHAMGGPVLLTKAGAETSAAAYAQEKNLQNGIVLGGKGLVSDTSVRRIFSLSASERIRIWPKYNINYVLSGGENSPENPSQYEQEVEVYLKNATKAYCSFGGWYLESDFQTRVKTISTDTVGELTLYAKWVPKSYNINYYLDGGENHPENPASYTYGQAAALYTPTKTNYQFAGWYLEDTFLTKADSITEEMGGSLKLYARWEPKTYTVSYALNGGENNAENPTTYVYGQRVSLAAPTKANYQFKGWYLEDTFTTKVDTITTSTPGDLTLYARWSPVRYKVYYVLDGGKNSPENPSEYSYGQSTTLNAPTKDHHQFAGWYLDDAFTVKMDTITPETAGKLTLYAKWEPVAYGVNYALYGGENSPENPTSYIYGQRISLAAPTKTNYQFKGWYLEDTFTTKVDTITQAHPGELTLHARWIPASFKVYYVLNNGRNNPDNPTEYTYGQTIPLAAPTRTNYQFTGWYLDSTFTVKMDTITPETAGKLTLYAQWEPSRYAIRYILNGGENHPQNPEAYTYGKSVALLAPTRENYRFVGWYLESTFLTKVDSIAKNTEGELVLYARWEIDCFLVHYVMNGGENHPENPGAYAYGDNIPLLEPLKDMYQFAGWYLEDTFLTKVDSITPDMTGDLTLYAKWEGTSYAIKYILSGGVNHPENPATYTYGQQLILKSPTKEGYTFTGWYRDRNLTQKVDAIGPDETGHLALYAGWQAQ